MKTILLLLFVLAQGMGHALKLPNQLSLNGEWLFSSASEKQFGSIPEEQLPTIRFNEDTKTASGFTGCNQFKATYLYQNESFVFDKMISTQKACTNLEVEMFIRPFLTQVGYYKLEQDKLYLFDKTDKKKFVIFTRVKTKTGAF